MTKPKHSGAFKGHRFPPEIIAYAVWAYYRFPMSLRDVEDLLAERGIIVSYETIRKWVSKFGRRYANAIRSDRPAPSDKWHLDEVVLPISGKKYWLWRAVDTFALAPFGYRLGVDVVGLTQLRERSLRSLYCRSDCVRRRGAAV